MRNSPPQARTNALMMRYHLKFLLVGLGNAGVIFLTQFNMAIMLQQKKQVILEWYE
jgi:hypothetical protein